MRIRYSLPKLLVALIIAWPANAHHPDADLDKVMGDREKFFQAVDAPRAPFFELAMADGSLVRLSDFADKIVVLNFVFASCTDVCPLHSAMIAEVQKKINISPMRDLVQFITITTDPVADTRDVLETYGEIHGLDAYNWMFLTTPADLPEDATRNLAEAYSVKFDPLNDGQQLHGAVTHIIDRQGRFAAKFHGLRFDPLNMVLYINGLTNRTRSATPSWWERVKGAFQ